MAGLLKLVTEGLKEFPTAQKVFRATFNNRYYRLLVYVIGFVAINMRSTIWRYISVSNPKGPNASAAITDRVPVASRAPN